MFFLIIFFFILLMITAIWLGLYLGRLHKIRKRRPPNIYPKPPKEPDPKGGWLYEIDYDNGYPLGFPRKIRVIFVIYRHQKPFLIRAYCRYITRHRWFKIHQITKIYDETGKPLDESAAVIFKDKSKFSRIGQGLPPYYRDKK